MRPGTITLICTALAQIISVQARQPPFYNTFSCEGGNCLRSARPISRIDPADLRAKGQHTSLAACRLVCNTDAGLWPLPTGTIDLPFVANRTYTEVHPGQFYFDVQNVPPETRPFLAEAADIFVQNLEATCSQNCAEATTLVVVRLLLTTDNLNLDWETKENYILNVAKTGSNITATISADTVYGARHALETLSQLTAPIRTPNGGMGLVMLKSAHIRDAPAFPHRGLLIDTARNFLSVEDILRTIDGLASTKMNVLHWHATDSQSFPIEIRSIPAMTRYGTYAPDKIYTVDDTANIVAYAKARGVRVILELDSPSHAGAGWNWGESAGLGKLAVCVFQQPWRELCVQPPCGQLNPVNPNTYKVLHDIYRDVLSIWGQESVLHLGGDEVFINCWNSTPEITSVMVERGMGRRTADFLDLWGTFHSSQLQVLDSVKGNSEDSVILWSSDLTSPGIITKYLNPSRYVIQTWVENNSPLPRQLLELGYRLIVSTKNAWYLDHGVWGSTIYHTWWSAYQNRIPSEPGVLGGEACMWGEYVDGGGLDARVWPRTAAVAERLWTDPSPTLTTKAPSRLQAHRDRLRLRGIQSDAIGPEWCSQHEEQCL